MKTIFLVNPIAGAGRSEHYWKHLKKCLDDEGFEYDYKLTEHYGHGIPLAKEAAQQGYQRIVSVGGDGSIHEMVNGVLLAESRDENARLAFIPTGSGNDLARIFDIPKEPGKIKEFLERDRITPMDVGRMVYDDNGTRKTRYFLSIAGAGYAADATDLANKYFKFLGRHCYLGGGVASFIIGPHTYMEITIDDRPPLREPFSMVAIANTPFAGGGMEFAPTADYRDGLLDVVLAHKTNRLKFAGLYVAMTKRRHLESPLISHFRAKRVKIDSDKKLALLADGEVFWHTPAIFDILPQALKIII